MLLFQVDKLQFRHYAFVLQELMRILIQNFLFLLYGPNSAALSEGENKANSQNAEFDRLLQRDVHALAA